eukprot:2678778-Pleurochrysis_carterae.AAC.3
MVNGLRWHSCFQPLAPHHQKAAVRGAPAAAPDEKAGVPSNGASGAASLAIAAAVSASYKLRPRSRAAADGVGQRAPSAAQAKPISMLLYQLQKLEFTIYFNEFAISTQSGLEQVVYPYKFDTFRVCRSVYLATSPGTLPSCMEIAWIPQQIVAGARSPMVVAGNRVRALSKVSSVGSNAGGVVYWMSRDQRVQDNWALLHARSLALSHGVGLSVVFCLVPTFSEATIRHYGFMLRGLKVRSKLALLHE